MDAKKVLVIGCEFSSGSYETHQPEKLGDMPRDQHVSSVGWYDHLDCLDGRSIDVYSMPGLGWLAYAHFLRGLRDSGMLAQYGLLIVQETFEPRFGILGNRFQSEFSESPTVDRKLDLQHWCYRGSPSTMIMTCDETGISFYKDFVSRNIDAHKVPKLVADEVLADISASNYIQTLLVASQTLVSNIVFELGLQMIVVSFSGSHLPCVDCIDQGPVNISSDVYSGVCLPNRGDYLTMPTKEPGSRGGRLTLLGNQNLGNRFNELIKPLLSS